MDFNASPEMQLMFCHYRQERSPHPEASEGRPDMSAANMVPKTCFLTDTAHNANSAKRCKDRNFSSWSTAVMLAQAELPRPQTLSGQIKLAGSRTFLNNQTGKKCLLV